MKLLGLLLSAFVLFGATGLLAADNPARVIFEANAVVGSGFNAGKQVVLYGCANPPQPYSRRLLSYLEVLTADANGRFRWEAPEPISQYSVWFAIGSIPADEVVAIPGRDASPISTLTPPRLLVGKDAGNDALAIADEMDDILVVRPDNTVWFGTAIRHGSADINRGLPGMMSFSIKTMKLKEAGNGSGNVPKPALSRLNPSDVVILVNPFSLRFFFGRLFAN
jgi:hypothetical protein